MPRFSRASPRKRPRQRRSRETVEALLGATARILVRDGYEAANTNRIAEAAGVSIGSLYQYFPNKQALVGELIDRHVNEQLAALHRMLSNADGASPDAAVRSVVHGLFEAYRVAPKLNGVLAELLPRLRRVHELERTAVSLVQGYLASRVELLPPMDVEHASFVLVTALSAVARATASARPPSLTIERIETETTALVLRYLGFAS